jgi:diguanylate cyclase (GGDEF)-like protein/PAS domain S-box-containing protein
LADQDDLITVAPASPIGSVSLRRPPRFGASAAEQRFALVFEQAPMAMALFSPEGLHLQVNPAYQRLVGREEHQLLGTSVLEVLEPADVPRLQAVRPRMLRGEHDHVVVELRFRRPDRSMVWGRVHIGAVRGADGSLRDTVAHIEDVSDRVRRDADLAASEQRYRTLVEHLPAPVVRYDRDLHPVLVGPAQSPVTVDDGDRWQELVQQVIATGQPHETQFETVVDGHRTWYQARAVPEHDEGGEVAHVLVVSSDITALKHSEAELVHRALHDPLTGLANRALLVEFLERSLTRRRGTGVGPALLFLDLDRFKSVNDAHGHRTGDALLVAVARRLRSVVRPSDLIARLGGDEFVVVIDGIEDPREPARVAQRLETELAAPFQVEGVEVETSASIGIAMATNAEADADTLLRDADAAMYLAKANGRNRFEIFDAVLRAQAGRKLRRESALRRAVDGDELEAYYQPEIDLRTGELVAVEALARWNHPVEGKLQADAFIELAEETGAIVAVGEWVLREACAEAARRGGWPTAAGLRGPNAEAGLRGPNAEAGLRGPNAEAGLRGPNAEAGDERMPVLGVNLSARQLAQPDVVDHVRDALVTTGLPPDRLCLEIAESALMEEPERNLAVLHELRGLGVTLAVDNVGTGQSSLLYLARFPLTTMKIDRRFVHGLGERRDDSDVVAAVIALGHALGRRVVADGVETRRQLDELRRLGGDGAQGDLFAPPAAAWRTWSKPSPVAL